jgi:ElaB/YqjD/DUF883 family membrane-anchored ribosome-binding protein
MDKPPRHRIDAGDTMAQKLEDLLQPLLSALEDFLKEFKRKAQALLEEETRESTFRKLAKELRERQERYKKDEQDNCPHVAGCNPLSEMQDTFGRTSIVWHTLGTGAAVGICTVCQRIFLPEDKDYAEWRAKPSFNRWSSAGTRFWPDGRITQFPTSQNSEEEFTPSYTQEELYQKVEDERKSIGGYAYPAEGLDALSDDQINKLFVGVREYRKALKNPEKALEKIFSGPEWSVRTDIIPPEKLEEENEPEYDYDDWRDDDY